MDKKGVSFETGLIALDKQMRKLANAVPIEAAQNEDETGIPKNKLQV
jgi:hypothetical protein